MGRYNKQLTVSIASCLAFLIASFDAALSCFIFSTISAKFASATRRPSVASLRLLLASPNAFFVALRIEALREASSLASCSSALAAFASRAAWLATSWPASSPF